MASFRLIVLVLVLVLAGCSGDLSQRPPQGGQPLDLSPYRSTLWLPLSLDVAALEDRALEQLPVTLHTLEEKRRLCADLWLGQTCETFLIRGEVKRRPGASLTVDDDALLLKLPVTVSARADAKGTVARLLVRGLDLRADGDLTLGARVRVEIASDWQPRVRAVLDHRWDDLPEISVLGLGIDIRGPADRELEKLLEKLTGQLEEQIQGQLPIRQQAEQAWQQAHRPVKIADQPPAWLLPSPRRLAFTGLTGQGQQLSTRIGLETTTRVLVGQEPPPLQVPPLPPLERVETPEAVPGFVLRVPFRLDYGALNDTLNRELTDKPLDYTSDDGQVAVQLSDVELYPSGAELVIGFDVDADLGWLGTQGRVYLIGTPALDQQNDRLYLADLRFTRRLDRWWASAAAWLFQEPIREQLARRVVFDFSEQRRQALAELNRRLGELGGDGVRIEGQADRLAVTQVAVGRNGLVLVGETRGRLTATVQP